MTITMVGRDIGKQFFRVHGVDAGARGLLREWVRRNKVASFLANLPPCTMGLEDCCGAHEWVRVLSSRGTAFNSSPRNS